MKRGQSTIRKRENKKQRNEKKRKEKKKKRIKPSHSKQRCVLTNVSEARELWSVFLVACTRLYKPLCRSVGLSVCRSVCLSAGLSVGLSLKARSTQLFVILYIVWFYFLFPLFCLVSWIFFNITIKKKNLSKIGVILIIFYIFWVSFFFKKPG